MQGTIIAVDAAKGTITVRVPNNDGTKGTTDQTYTLGTAKVLIVEGLNKGDPPVEGKIKDLSEGIPVQVQLSEDKKSLVSVTARGQNIQAVVKAVDAGTQTLTVLTKDKKEQSEKSFTLVKDIKVLLNDMTGGKENASKDQEGKLTDLTADTHVSLQLSVDQKRVLGIRVVGATIAGTLVGYDAGTNTITISTKGDGDKSYPVLKDASLVDLTQGSRVQLRFSVFEKGKVIAAHGQGQKEKE